MKKIFSYYIATGSLLAILVMGACKVSKDVARPDAALPATYRDATSDTVSISTMPWQDFFEDAALKTLITNALAHNNDLQVALKNIDAAALVLKQAKLGNIPSLGLQASAVTNRPSDNSFNGLNISQALKTNHVEDYTLAANLSWEADIWGKIRSQKAAALAGYLQRDEARKVVQTQLVSDVAKGYYNLLVLDALLAIAQKNVRLNDSTLKIIVLQYNAGQVTSLAVQQATAQKISAQELVPQFEQQLSIQENALSILTGSMPAPVTRDLTLDATALKATLQVGIPATLLSRRPDVRLSELELSKSNAEVGYAKANMYPSLTITAQGGLDAFKASNWFNIPASLFGAVAGSITQPLFQQRKLRTQYEIAKITRDQSVIRFRQSILVAVQEVSDALVTLNKLDSQQTLAATRTSTLREATHNSQLLFKNGLATYLEVITAQGNVLQSELELANIKKAQLDATVDLYRAVGGGWN